jgi:outer membrane protein TolC
MTARPASRRPSGSTSPCPGARKPPRNKRRLRSWAQPSLRYDAALLDIQSAIAEARERLKAARQADALVAHKALPEARAVLNSVTADYSQGRGELAIALEAQHRVHALELKLFQLQMDEQSALAAIERLIGGEL